MAQAQRERQIPEKVVAEYWTQPPIFSGVPWRKRILSHSYQPPSVVYRVFSRLTPDLNRILESGMWYLSVAAFSHLTQKKGTLGFSALDQSGQNLAPALGPDPERIGCPLPVPTVGFHPDGGPLEVA